MYPIKKLGEIAKVYAGSSAPQEDKYFEKGIFPFVRTSDLGKYGKTKNLTIVSDYINDLCLKEKSLTFAKKGTIIFPKSGASILSNHRGILGVDAYFVSHLAGIDSGNEITNNYIYNYLLQLDLVDYCDNPAYPSLQLLKIKNIPIPLPPLPTQKLIVQKLDSSFENINKQIDLIKKNLSSLEDLNKSVLEKVFSEGEYEIKKLGEISKTTSGGTPLRDKKEYWGGNIPWLKSGELNDNLKINSSEEFITEIGLKNSSAKIFKKGTLLIALYGATAGKLGILDFDSTTNQAVCSVQNLSNLFIEKYLFYFLLSKRQQIIKDSFGGAQPNISKTYLDQIKIPLPPLQKQKEIVSYLDEVFSKNKELKTKYELQLKELEELKQSLLKDAFEGRLIP